MANLSREERNRKRGEDLREAQFRNYIIDIKSKCWLWLGLTNKDDYGKVKRLGKTVLTHRLFYTKHKGEIPEGLNVLHTCDRPRCVNPDHLFLGTQLDNEQDKDAKGRRRNGNTGPLWRSK